MKILIGAALAAAAATTALVGSATAHAGPDSYYLNCINTHGFTITNTSEALLWAQIVQDEEIAGVSRGSIISLLMSDGADYGKASVIVDCAWKAYNS